MEPLNQYRAPRWTTRGRVLRGLVIGLTLFLALMVVIAARTMMSTSKQLDIDGVETVSPLPGFAERLSAAIKIRTISERSAGKLDEAPFDELHELLVGSFPQAFACLEFETFGGHSLLLRWRGADSSSRPILLMSHIDVVPVEGGTEDDWTYPPFSGEIADGYVWGRGTLDVKCGAMGLLEAVERLVADGFRPGCDVYLAFGHDEETGGDEGNRRIAETLKKRGVRFRFVLDEGGGLTQGIIDGIEAPVAFVGIAEKGYATLGLEATGGGHSSMPPRQTSIGRLAAAVARLEDDPLPARLDGATGAMLDFLGPEMPWPRRAALANRWLTGGLIARQFSTTPALNALIRTSTPVTVFRGGESEHALPGRATAVINIRLRPGDSAESTKAHILDVVGDEEVRCVRWEINSEASAVSSADSAGFRALHRTIAEVYPGTVVAPGLSMVATDSRHYAAIADDLYRFLPMRVRAEDLERIHGTDERIAVMDYADLIGFLARLIENLSDPEAAGGSASKAASGAESAPANREGGL